MGQTQTGFTDVYAQSLSADYDFDLRANDMILVHDNLFVMIIISAELLSNPIMLDKVTGRT